MERKIVQGLLLGKSVNELSRELRACKKTIKRVRERAESAGYLSGKELPSYPESLFPDTVDGRSTRHAATDEALERHAGWIKARLEEDKWLPITVYEELPVKVGRASFYLYLRRHGHTTGHKIGYVVSEIVTEPGESLQVDWGKLRDVVIEVRRGQFGCLQGCWATHVIDWRGLSGAIRSKRRCQRYKACLNSSVESLSESRLIIQSVSPPRQTSMSQY